MDCRVAGRLGRLCAALHLTPEEFADQLGIPLRRTRRLLRPWRTINPKLLARVHAAWPELNPRWMISGEGPVLLPAFTHGNHVGVNYGHNVQIIQPPCSCAADLLQAQLHDKERLIQLLLRQFPLPPLSEAA